MGFSLVFQGTSISVYFNLAEIRTECNFILNGSLEKSFVHTPLSKKGMEYNVEVFKKEGLEDKLHTLNVETGKKDYEVYIAFDYAAYTAEEPDQITDTRNDETTAASPTPSGSSDPKSKSSRPTGTIIGGAIGGLALIGAVLLAFFACRKRRNGVVQCGDESGNNVHIDPFMAHPETFDPHQTPSTPPFRSGGLPVVSSTKASGLLVRQQQQQLDRMREELSSLESQSRQNRGNGGFYAPSDSGTIQSGIVQGEMTELRRQIRELQAQMLRPGRPRAVVSALPPKYTP
ncbi:hypothetical protein AAF712_010445 [Marasmius tenuissimus]|uniref:Uncharacterized protein n=1 Tax=Marasmius tenuissimus TaxID=585030 RepID=A0ABR2ZM78_9AGAR